MQITNVSSWSQNFLKIDRNVSFKNEVFQNKAKVSVILPIYNQEKYLEKALVSLQNQTLKDIEIICVNDGSKDKSLDILKEFA